MTLEEISLVQNTWAKVVPIKEAAGGTVLRQVV